MASSTSAANAMQMLTKFESKSSRAKGIAFHPKLPWILVSLHSSTIQWWEIRMGSLIDRFEEHDGPVRGIAFHPSQPLFVSGGDDYKIKVWNYKTRRCLFTLHGHLDYVRTVFFHHEHPWILSCSDDQTVRVWNWQSRSCIAILTGHNHYVMCAQFHPSDDLIVSASLDQTVRVWDISGLRKKHTTPINMTFEDQMVRSHSSQADIFGNTDAIVKYVLEGHERGVNWVSFHPTLPLIVSGGDDRLVKLWRMSDTKAWEVDTCRGHFNNVSSCLFHPHLDLIISVGEDRSIRVWDMNRRTCVQSFRRESDRFWVICAHPGINLFAAGHDNGVMVFKLQRERPPYAIHQNSVYYLNRERDLKLIELNSKSEPQTYLSLKSIGTPWIPPRTMSYNAAERKILVTSTADGGVYQLVNIPREPIGSAEPPEIRKGVGDAAVFVARNRFAVLIKSSQTVEIRDLSNASTKTFKPPITVNDMYYGGVGILLLCGPSAVALYDMQQKKTIAELHISGIKYAIWSEDGNHIALLGKHTVTIVTKHLVQMCTNHETIRIKSAAWEDGGVLFYSTLNHIKYMLSSGDVGIVCTLLNPIYLLRVKGRNVYALDRDGCSQTLLIDPTEYRFKLALLKKNYDEMIHLIKTSNLVGQSIIAYLQKKGFPEIALQFVQDPQTKFDLGIECGNLEIATEMAKQLDNSKLWSILANEALQRKNHQIVEMAYQKLKKFDKLSFLYLVTGNHDKLSKMGRIAEQRGDHASQFQNSLFSGDVDSRIRMLKEANLYPLAYLTAKTRGLTDECDEILQACKLSEENMKLPDIGIPQLITKPVFETFKEELSMNLSKFNKFKDILDAQMENLKLDVVVDKSAEDELQQVISTEENEGGWDLGEDLEINDDKAFETQLNTASDVQGTPETDFWVRNSPIPADHMAAGSFETGMQLLNRQIGAVHFEPLKLRCLELYQASRTFLPGIVGMSSMEHYVRRDKEEIELRKVSPRIPYSLDTITESGPGTLQEAYALFKANKLEPAVEVFRSILHAIMLMAVDKRDQEDLERIITVCREYILGLSIEMLRRSLGKDNESVKRNLELAAYFAHVGLLPEHRQIALQIAMRAAFEAKNMASAATFATRYLELMPNGKIAEQARKIKATGDRNPNDAVEFDYDPFAEFTVCAFSFTPIYTHMESIKCPFTGAVFLPEYKGKVSPICKVVQIGASATGLRYL